MKLKCKRIAQNDLLMDNALSEKYQWVVSEIKEQSLFIYPTETLYGIGGAAAQRVKEKMSMAKKRPSHTPFILIAGSIHLFKPYDILFTDTANRLAACFWPGKMTLVLPRKNSDQTIGIRVSPHPVVQLLTQHVAAPLYSTSANMSGEPYVNDPDTIYNLFCHNAAFMIDNGILPRSDPSTVVAVTKDNTVSILREGVIPSGQIRSALERYV